MNKILSTKAFLVSHAVIFILSLTFLAGLYYLLNKDIKEIDLKNYIPVSQKPISLSLEINNPEDELLVFDKTLVVSGKTSPKVSVIITNNSQTSDQTVGLEASDKGDFSKVLNLFPGINQITVWVFDNEGNAKSDSRMVYMSEEKLP